MEGECYLCKLNGYRSVGTHFIIDNKRNTCIYLCDECYEYITPLDYEFFGG